MSTLTYSKNNVIGNNGDTIIVSLIKDEDESLLFTGTIYNAAVHGARYCLSLTDDYKKLCDTIVTPAYRKERALNILQDTLDAAGITERNITCPAVEIKRFSTDRITADMCIRLLIKALDEHGEKGLRYFFDDKNVFHFGKNSGSGKTEGVTFNFTTGEDIIKKGDGFIEVLPYPIRHSQSVIIDARELQTYRTSLYVSQRISRLVLWAKEAA